MTVKELHELLRDFKEEFGRFKENDFHHLEQKVDRNSWFIGIGVGVLLAAQVILQVLL